MSPIFPFKQLWKQFGLLTCVSTQSGSQKKWIVSALMSALINNHICQKTHSFERTPRLFHFQVSAQKLLRQSACRPWTKTKPSNWKTCYAERWVFTLWFNTIIYHWTYPAEREANGARPWDQFSLTLHNGAVYALLRGGQRSPPPEIIFTVKHYPETPRINNCPND